MKKLNALALCAVMAPAYALGIGSAVAAEDDKTAATQQEASESIAGERNPGKDDTSSATTAEAGDGSGAANVPNEEELGEPYTNKEEASESAAGDSNPSGSDSSSATTAEARDGSGAAEAPNNQTEDRGQADTTQQKASESVAGEGSPGREETSSDATAKARDGNGAADVPNNQTGEADRSETPDVADSAEPAFHADDLIGQKVKSRNDDATFGTISDLVFGENGQLLSVVVEVGGFLGIGEEQVTISWSELERQLDADGESYVIYRQPR